MKNIFRIATGLLSVSTLLLLQGCIKDVQKNTYTYTYYEPVYAPYNVVLANIKSNPSADIAVPGKIAIKGNYIYVNEVNKGIHIIDNSKHGAPVNIAFIDVPGNVDIAVKGNTLYADFYTDLVAIDITDPLKASVKNIVKHIFPERSYYGGFTGDNSQVIASWIKKTVTVTGNNNVYPYYPGGVFYSGSDAGLSHSASPKATPAGINGSLSRFALINNYLYSVGYDSLRVTDVSVEDSPVPVNSVSVGWGIETLYPFKDKLFIGSTSGMFIFSVANATLPQQLGTFSHARTCDPVIADDNTAYVTLHSGTECLGFSNQLDVLNITDILNPALIKTYPLVNPRGLSKDGDLLFICDGDAGLKVFDAGDSNAITLIKQFDITGANDVIAYDNVALVMAGDGIYQYDYSDKLNIKLLSKIAISN
jgi:hypothetical protein